MDRKTRRAARLLANEVAELQGRPTDLGYRLHKLKMKALWSAVAIAQRTFWPRVRRELAARWAIPEEQVILRILRIADPHREAIIVDTRSSNSWGRYQGGVWSPPPGKGRRIDNLAGAAER